MNKERTEKSLHILLAEDNLVNQKVIAKILTRSGHTFQIANNGSEALLLHQNTQFDLILMDVQMPEMDGIAASTLIRNAESNSVTPIIAITSSSEKNIKERCLSAGMNEYLPKPFEPKKLLDTIADIMTENMAENTEPAERFQESESQLTL